MTDTKTEPATFAAGCFWGVEAEFRQIPGVIATTVGHMYALGISTTVTNCFCRGNEAKIAEPLLDTAQAAVASRIEINLTGARCDTGVFQVRLEGDERWLSLLCFLSVSVETTR